MIIEDSKPKFRITTNNGYVDIEKLREKFQDGDALDIGLKILSSKLYFNGTMEYYKCSKNFTTKKERKVMKRDLYKRLKNKNKITNNSKQENETNRIAI